MKLHPAIDLAVIIVSWNCREYLVNCLRSLEAAGTKCSWTVLVVDNNSSDGTVEALASRLPHIKVISNPENVGFAAANNQAIRLVSARYIMLLNPDTVVRPGAFNTLVDFLDRNENAWAAGPEILAGDGLPYMTGMTFPINWDVFMGAVFLDS